MTKDQADMLAECMERLLQTRNIEGYAHAEYLADLIHQTNEHHRDSFLQEFQRSLAQYGKDNENDHYSYDLDL